MANLKLIDINKIYANGVQAVFDFNIEIEDGEFIVLVGPSGCGKSTTLRMIAGLESITSGEMILDDVLINKMAPSDRDIAMVFQNYALYGHMSVYENMGFSLKINKEDPNVIHDAVMDTLDIVDLDGYLNRKPSNLSGGQRQRVALGRTIVRDPKLFLMDEPLSNLDAKLRQKTRVELVNLHHRIGATTVYVTHDQIEAMTMASRIVVMKDGYVQQIGTPEEIYSVPENVFVGGFIGSPPMHFIKGQISKNYFTADDENIKVKIDAKRKNLLTNYTDKEVYLGIRPEHFTEMYTSANKINLNVNFTEFLGSYINIHGAIGNHKMIAKVDGDFEVSNNTSITLGIDLEKIHFFDIDTTLRIREEE